MEITVTIFYAKEDTATSEVLKAFSEFQVPGVRWNWWALPVRELCRRSIGRNLAALRTTADWVWFCDADYWFDSDCWDVIAAGLPADAELIFPDKVRLHRTHAMGDQCIERAAKTKGLVAAVRSEFARRRMKRAIGGIQIARGDVCRELGYLRDSQRAQTPAPASQFTRCRQDVGFRRSLSSPGRRFKIPGVYRIRHSAAGRSHPGLVL